MNTEKAEQIDALKEQCGKCKMGDKKVGPRSGCDVRKKLVTDQSEVAWKHSHLFLTKDGKCKMFAEKARVIL